MFHVDSFTCTITEKGRSPLVEEPETPTAHIEAGLLVLASVEAGDESSAAEVAEGSATEIQKLAGQLGVREIVLLPFAHLFAELAPMNTARDIVDSAAERLRSVGLRVERPPFGWFHTWELKAKGHPLSRVARTIRPNASSGAAR